MHKIEDNMEHFSRILESLGDHIKEIYRFKDVSLLIFSHVYYNNFIPKTTEISF